MNQRLSLALLVLLSWSCNSIQNNKSNGYVLGRGPMLLCNGETKFETLFALHLDSFKVLLLKKVDSNLSTSPISILEQSFIIYEYKYKDQTLYKLSGNEFFRPELQQMCLGVNSEYGYSAVGFRGYGNRLDLLIETKKHKFFCIVFDLNFKNIPHLLTADNWVSSP